MNAEDIQTKLEATAYVAAVLRSSSALLHDPSFKAAMDLSRRFDISAQDLLTYRKEQAKLA